MHDSEKLSTSAPRATQSEDTVVSLSDVQDFLLKTASGVYIVLNSLNVELTCHYPRREQVDSLCGLYILILYILYLNLVRVSQTVAADVRSEPCRSWVRFFPPSNSSCKLLYLYWHHQGALGVFDCSKNTDGIFILDADPSIVCNEVGEVLSSHVLISQSGPPS